MFVCFKIFAVYPNDEVCFVCHISKYPWHVALEYEVLFELPVALVLTARVDIISGRWREALCQSCVIQEHPCPCAGIKPQSETPNTMQAWIKHAIFQVCLSSNLDGTSCYGMQRGSDGINMLTLFKPTNTSLNTVGEIAELASDIPFEELYLSGDLISYVDFYKSIFQDTSH